MSQEERPELTSWKEIARRCGRSVRTVQLWEKERGLPVRRVPGKHGGVFLRHDELERWLDGLKGDRITETVSGVHAGGQTTMLVAVSVLALAAAAVWWPLLPVGSPAAWHIEGDSLVVEDGRGSELWRHEFAEGLTRDASAAPRLSPQFIDLEEDGSIELLFVHAPRSAERSDTLICFASDGTERWRYRPSRTISTAQGTIDDTYVISPVKVGRFGDGSRMVVVGSHHRLFYPSNVAVLSAEGRFVSDYWHAGHIGSDDMRLQVLDLNEDGKDEIYAAGVNNARDLATLVVLDPKTMSGAGKETNTDYQFLDLPQGNQTARVFFPRSSISQVGDRFNIAFNLITGPNTITVAVQESILLPQPPAVFYEFDTALKLRDVQLSDTFIGAHRRLQREGLVSLDLLQEKEALYDIEVIR